MGAEREELEETVVGRLAARAERDGLAAHVPSAITLLSARVADPSPQDIEACLLVAGCVADDRRAQGAFEARYVRPVRPALRALGLDEAAVDDVLQRVWVKLFVRADGTAAPIVGYVGKGDLGAFVKIVATRLALSDRRARKAQVGDDKLVEMVHQATPQHHYLEAAAGHWMREAVELAAGDLTPGERVLLRLSHVDALTVDEIGAMYGVHRSTAARRVARARTRLIEGVRAHLKERLDVASAELDSLMRDVQSHLDLSISRILRH